MQYPRTSVLEEVDLHALPIMLSRGDPVAGTLPNSKHVKVHALYE